MLIITIITRYFYIKNSNFFEDSSSIKDNSNINLIVTENYLDNSKNEKLDDYYDNFYNI